MHGQSDTILITGAGIAGLTAAIAFARSGRHAIVVERAAELEEVGAGLQLSPNATRLLARFGVLERLDGRAARPSSVVLRRAGDGREVARIALGDKAISRWASPYLTVHRADLQAALLETVHATPGIDLRLGRTVGRAGEDGPGTWIEADGERIAGALLIAADGVRSVLRGQLKPGHVAEPSGHVAWRTTIDAGHRLAGAAGLDGSVVTTFLHRDVHLVAYPLRAGKLINLVAVTRQRDATDAEDFRRLMTVSSPVFATLAAVGGWLRWPLFRVAPGPVWRHGERTAFIGDAAHAVTPFAAQGAAMAIEDVAALLAALGASDEPRHALSAYAAAREPRLRRVGGRGAFNHFAWHAFGPVAVGRDLVLAALGNERLAASLDWLYGFDAAA